MDICRCVPFKCCILILSSGLRHNSSVTLLMIRLFLICDFGQLEQHFCTGLIPAKMQRLKNKVVDMVQEPQIFTSLPTRVTVRHTHFCQAVVLTCIFLITRESRHFSHTYVGHISCLHTLQFKVKTKNFTQSAISEVNFNIVFKKTTCCPNTCPMVLCICPYT